MEEIRWITRTNSDDFYNRCWGINKEGMEIYFVDIKQDGLCEGRNSVDRENQRYLDNKSEDINWETSNGSLVDWFCEINEPSGEECYLSTDSLNYNCSF